MSHDIFYRKRGAELNGPISEQQAQLGYRKGFFEESVLFFFVEKEEAPAGDDVGTTLGKLIARNGEGSPFAKIVEGENNADRMQKMEESLDALRKKAAKVRELEARLEAIEKKLQSHFRKDTSAATAKQGSMEARVQQLEQSIEALTTDAPPWEEAAGGAGTIDARSEEEEEATRLALERFDFQSEYIVYIYDLLQVGDIDAMLEYYRVANERLDEMKLVEPREARLPLFRAVCAKLKRKQFIYCGLCNMQMFNYQNALVHLVDKDHMIRVGALVPFEPDCVQILRVSQLIVRLLGTEIKKLEQFVEWDRASGHEADLTSRVPRSRRGSKPAPTVPTQAFYGRLFADHAVTAFNQGEMFDGTPSVCIMEEGLPKLIANGVPNLVVTELNAHLSGGLTVCGTCQVETVTAAAFYDHVLGYAHIKRAGPFDILTLAVNLVLSKY